MAEETEMVRVLAELYRPAEHGMEAYYGDTLDVSFMEGVYDHTCLAIGNMLSNLQPMYAGDHVRVTVFVNGEVRFQIDRKIERYDDELEQYARQVEGGRF